MRLTTTAIYEPSNYGWWDFPFYRYSYGDAAFRHPMPRTTEKEQW
jgi:hypothetical protein